LSEDILFTMFEEADEPLIIDEAGYQSWNESDEEEKEFYSFLSEAQ